MKFYVNAGYYVMLGEKTQNFCEPLFSYLKHKSPDDLYDPVEF